MALRPVVLRYDSLPSTNDEAARQAVAGAPEGVCVLAREQTAGRGRQGRAWASPRGAGLYLSVLLRPKLEAARWPLITLAGAVAVREALAEACGLAADIKWPNDLLARGRKLCGILAETPETPTGRACVLGVGVNLRDQSFPPELAARVTSVEAETGRAPDAETLLQSITRSLAVWYEALHEEGGGARVLREWEARSSFARGLRVRVTLDSESFEGLTRGLEPDGALRVETDARELRILRAADVEAVRRVTGDR